MNELIEFWNNTEAKDLFIHFIGYLACITMIFGFLPQTIQTIKTRSTDDIAFGTFLLMGIGGFCFAIQGYLLENYPLLITNILTTSMSAIITAIKIKNDYFKKKITRTRV